MLFHAIGLVGVEEGEARLTRDRIAQQVPQLAVADEVDEPVGIGRRVAVIGGKHHEGVAGLAPAQGALEGAVEQRGLGRVLRRPRAGEVCD